MQRALLLAILVGLGVQGAAAQNRPPPAQAQPAQSQPVQVPQRNERPSGPISIDADRLEVRDRERRATFTGNVVAKRGDGTMRATVMVVLYDGTAAGQTTPAAPGTGQEGQQIRRIEMTGPVFFCQRDQAARGDNAVYERATELLVMTGNVVLTQGPNVVTGPRLVVNLRTNQAQVERDPANPNERVRSLLVPNDARGQAPAPPPRPQC